jgi:hypothetical protein
MLVSPEEANKIVKNFYNKFKSTSIKSQEVKQMAKISDFVEGYKSLNKTKNISELPEVSTELEMEDDEYEYTDAVTKQTKVVKQKVVTLNGERYRVPVTVIQQLKVILKDNAKITRFKVIKSGTTKDDTRYQVIPLG